MYIVTADEMREMDRRTIESFGVPGRVLMENAGRGAVRFFLKCFKGLAGKKVAVAAGKGNNGGDGFVMARCLAQKGVHVTVYLFAARADIKGDAAANLDLLTLLNVPVTEVPDPGAFSQHKTGLLQHDIWVDALLGTGLTSEVRPFFKQVITFINHLNKPIFSVDIPSGLNADTGLPCGECIRAHCTATFAFPKIGHLVYPGAGLTGRLKVVDIGIPAYIAEAVGPRQFVLTDDHAAGLLQPRSGDAHKGHTGHLLVVAGSPGKTGAAAMTAMSAMRAGAGLVTLGIARGLNPVLESMVAEPMTLPLAETGRGTLSGEALDTLMEVLDGKQCLAVGPGLGTHAETQSLVRDLVRQCPVPMVIDADGLNCLTGHTQLLESVNADVVLTPHPGEMARLAGISTAAVQADRLGCARAFARRHNVSVVLKGANTIIAGPDGTVCVNTTGNAGMASGGMGDVLTGMIAGFIAQGYSAKAAMCLGVYLHGAAADELALTRGPVGFLATEVMAAVPGRIRKLRDRFTRRQSMDGRR